MFSDLEAKGVLRSAPEDFNLAAHADDRDELHAEFIRTFRSVSFCGYEFVNRYKQTLRHEAVATKKVTLPRATRKIAQLFSARVFAAEIYGYRGRDPRVYYLSPWEFAMYWCAVRLLPPQS